MKKLIASVLLFLGYSVGVWAEISPVQLPDQQTIERMAAAYYAQKGEWAGKFTIVRFLDSRIEKRSPTHLVAHLKYIAAFNQAREHQVEDQRTFDFVYRNQRWEVIKMGGHKSARF